MSQVKTGRTLFFFRREHIKVSFQWRKNIGNAKGPVNPPVWKADLIGLLKLKAECTYPHCFCNDDSKPWNCSFWVYFSPSLFGAGLAAGTETFPQPPIQTAWIFPSMGTNLLQALLHSWLVIKRFRKPPGLHPHTREPHGNLLLLSPDNGLINFL